MDLVIEKLRRNVLEKKYLILKVDNHIKEKRELGEESYSELRSAAESLEEFNTLAFLSNSYVKAKEDFMTYDFTQFDVREIDMFNMILNALEAISTNRNLWEAYLKRSYRDNNDVYTCEQNGEKKSCFGLKDSEFYDKHIEFVVSKVLRNMTTHHSKPYSKIIYDDNLQRHFIVTREDLLGLGEPNASARKFISNNDRDYYDVVEVIKRSFGFVEEINTYVFNFILKKEWHRYINARYTVRSYVGIDWQGAYLVYADLRYPESHPLYLSQINISKKAMNAICSIAAKSICDSSSDRK